MILILPVVYIVTDNIICKKINMIIDVLQQICNLTDIQNQIKLIGINKLTYMNVFIREINRKKSFFSIEPYLEKEVVCDHLSKLKTDILKQKKFSRLEHLYFRHVSVDLTRLIVCKTTLTSLDFSFSTNLKYKKSLGNIKKLHGVELKMNLSNVNFENMLSFSGQLDQAIFDRFMNLQYLDVWNWYLPLNVTPMCNIRNTLTTLICAGQSNPIDQKILDEFNILRYLDCTDNNRINNVDKFSDTMEILHCTDSNIHDISKLKKLKEFCDFSDKSHNFENVVDVITSIGCYNIDQKIINKMTKLGTLKIRSENHSITNLNHLKNTLTILDLYYNGRINCDAIRDLYKIYAFRGHIENIYDCYFTRSLRELQDAFIDQNELEFFGKLRALYLCNTHKSYNLSHLDDTLKILYAVCKKCDGIPKNLKYLCGNYSTFNLEDRKYIYEKYKYIFEQCNGIYDIVSGFHCENGNWWSKN